MIDVRKILEAGQVVLDTEHDAKEVLKRGTLRIGSAGAVIENGEVHGTCHRIALSRMLGVDKPVDAPRRIMFAAGNANEDIWYEIVKRGWNGKIFREEEIAVEWTVPGSDVKVTGRPDMVLADENGVPVQGIELKGVFSLGTAKSVELDGKPKDEHLIQAAMYSMLLNIPWTLAYTNASVVDLQFDRKKYGLAKIEPFYRMFQLTWEDDRLFYLDEHKSEKVRTEITKSSLTDFYSMIVEMRDTKQLGPRPASGGMDGSKAYWSKCDAKYCPFSAACDKHEDNYDKWIKAITE